MMVAEPLPSPDAAVRALVETGRADCLSGPDSPEGRETGALVGANATALRARQETVAISS